jgi:predicted house-cleaning noncanonical NTP pyrophosphatase (MazG superfamily)
MKKIYYKKLIRDEIPKRIEESGGKYLCKKLNQKDFKKELLKKVSEESNGITFAKKKKEIISEIGDVLDVIDEIKKVFKISSEEIKGSRKNEFRRKGGFKKKQYLVWAEDTGYKSNERKGK